jgi:hypothetical protein
VREGLVSLEHPCWDSHCHVPSPQVPKLLPSNAIGLASSVLHFKHFGDVVVECNTHLNGSIHQSNDVSLYDKNPM